jgi:catechol 2,3-dioxygenase-like lactoylglutathione lyase family enzyme
MSTPSPDRRQNPLASAKLVAFAATTNPERAKAFYGDVLGLRPISQDGFALVFEVMEKAGVQFERYPGVDEMGRTAPGGARVAWFKDPDGNILSVSQHP